MTNQVEKRFFYTLLAITCVFMQATASNDSIHSMPMELSADSMQSLMTEQSPESAAACKPSLLTRVMSGMEKFFMGCDTNYVTPQKYQMTAQLELSFWHDYYFMRSSVTGNSMTIQSDPSVILGGYVYYSILGYGVVWNLNDLGIPAGKTNGTSMRQSVVIHTAKFFAEYYKFNSGKGAEIENVSEFDLTGRDRTFRGLDSNCDGFSAVYMFNNKRFSWPAAFGANAVQRKSCGSWSIGFQYNHQRINMDKDALPDYLRNDIDSTLLFNNVDYHDYSVSIGYNYNCVLGRNVLLAASVMPNIGYRRSNITEAQEEKHSILNNLATDLNLRLSLFWNNTKVFSGLIFELRTYDYRKDKFGLTNTYGILKYMLGFNFWKKPQPRL